jgi:hypothetical protein
MLAPCCIVLICVEITTEFKVPDICSSSGKRLNLTCTQRTLSHYVKKVIRIRCLCMKSISRFCVWWSRSSTKSCVFRKILILAGSAVIGPGSCKGQTFIIGYCSVSRY